MANDGGIPMERKHNLRLCNCYPPVKTFDFAGPL